MDIYIYYSIILFSIFIILLYIYLLYEKILNIYKRKRRNRYEEKMNSFTDNLINSLENRNIQKAEVVYIKSCIKSKIRTNIIIDRVIKYNEIYTGAIRDEIIKLCEITGLVDLEINNLKSKNEFKVALACKHLGEYRSEKAIEPLLEKLNVDSLDIKYHIFMAIAKIGNIEAFMSIFYHIENLSRFSERSLIEIIDSFEGDKTLLYKNMIDNKDEFLSTLFIKSSANYMDFSLNPYLFKHINDDNKERVIAVIKAIGKSVDIRYIDNIIEKLNSEDWEIRAIAAKSLGRFEDERALEPLIRSLSDSHWWVRYNSANGIIKIKNGIRSLEKILLSEDRFAKDSIIAALEDSGVIQDIFLYENLVDDEKRETLHILKEYIIRTKEKGESWT